MNSFKYSSVNQVQKKNDVLMGIQNETEVQKILSKHFSKRVHKFTQKYSIFDFYMVNDNSVITDYVELKSRRNDIKKYPTQFIGLNKIERGFQEIKKGKNVYLCFKLTDGLYMYKLKFEDEFKTIISGNFYRNDKASELCLIPNNILIKIHSTP